MGRTQKQTKILTDIWLLKPVKPLRQEYPSLNSSAQIRATLHPNTKHELQYYTKR